MNTIEFILYLRSLNIQLSVNGDKLSISGEKELFTSELQTQLAQHKSEILAFLNQVNSDISTSIQPTPRNQDLPLSFAQQRLWFLDQLEGKNATYNIALALNLQGELNLTALTQTFQEIINRHEILRTNFKQTKDIPIQEISATTEIEIPIINLEKIPPSQQSSEIQKLANQSANKPFNLSNDTLIRVTILRLSETSHILLLTIHHIISDGWSMGILVKEISTIYTAICQNQEYSLPALPIQYVDFAVWQRQWLTGEILDNQINYWKQQLADIPPRLELPTDYPRPPIQTFKGNTENFTLDTQLTQKLKHLSQKSGTTLFMTLLGAFSTLLYRYSRQSDLVVGSPIANRNRAEIESLIGFFVNTLVLRIQLENHPSFAELLNQIKQTCLDAYAHQDLPFEKLVEALKPERNLSYSPLFQVMFVLENTPKQEYLLPNLKLSSLEIERDSAKFDLTLSITETETELTGVWEYNSDLFKAATIQRMIGNFQILLAGIVENPEQKISHLPILTEAERHQILVEWNNTKVDYPQNQCIHQLFEAQVEKTPDGIAVVFEGETLTYRELNEKSNQLAHYLQKLGVKPEVKVGICVERSVEMIIGLLGILKAGGAYVPLDPNYPSERLRFMLDDAQVPILLTQAKLIELIPKTDTKIVTLDFNWEIISQENKENLCLEANPNHLAYINYTSGSTGKPKGVLVVHQGVIRLLFGINYISLNQTKKILQIASISFDAATFEIWGALLHGARCVLFPETVPTAQKLKQTIKNEKITTLWLTSSLFNSIIDESLETFSGLEELLTGGEALSVSHIKKALKGLSSTQLINGYGPTENTTFTCCYAIPENLEQTVTSIPIGRPISNTKIYILDSYLQPVPIGVIGELHIGGDGLARGYLNRPELTAEKFIPNPFESGRLYKTGDLARYLPDGNIEYIGRIDHQVKLRGFRIELGEIETVFSQHPQINSVIVIVREDQPGDKRLVAYIVSETEKLNSTELRSFLKQKLPEYMIPSVFVQLETLPLTPNGKIDRRALPKPDTSDYQTEDEYMAPRTETESKLAGIWSEVLKLEKVGINSNFFALGGHSLLATQIISRIRENFSVEIPLRSLFESPTIGEISQTINLNSLETTNTQTSPIQPTPRNQDLPLSFAQQRLWFLDQLEGKSPAYNMPMALHLQGELKISALEKTLNTIIQRHETLRTNIATSEGKPQIIIHENLQLELPIIDLENRPEAQRNLEAEELIKQERLQPFDLENHPLIRCKLLRLQPQEHILLITIHHIISDGWSINLLNQEIGKIYNAFVEGKPSPLPELTIQYIDFVAWQKEYLTGEIFQQQLAYWKKQLEDAPPLLTFPTDYPRPTIQTFTGEKYSNCLSENLSNSLKELSKQEGVTLFITLLTAFKILLYRYTGEKDIILGSPVAGRNRREVESLIGFFINTLVLRTNLDDNPTFKELLAVVKKVALEGYEYQAMPFEKLVEELQPERNLSHNPIFQIWFNMVNLEFKPLEMSGLEVETIASNEGFSKFDLTLYVREKENEIQLDWSYNRDLYQPETIATIAKHFKNLLESIVVHPEQSISTVPLLTELETQQLKNDKNAIQSTQVFTEFTKAEIEQSIPARFEKQVIKYSQNIAIKSNTYQWNYEILNQKANQISANLIKQCGKQSQKIALLFEHDAPMIAAILGVLKAGKTYIPLDPNYPLERINYILADAQATAILTNHKNHHLAQKLNQQNLTIINIDNSNLEAEINLGNQSISPDTIAYILYTSGSTGQPKGVVQNHRNVLHFIRNYTNNLHISSSDKLTLIASYSFDAAVMDIWGGLLNGGTLCLYDLKTVGLTNLITWLQTEKITIYHSTPTVYRYFLQTLENQVKDNLFPEMRLVVLGGEAVVKKDVDLYQQYFPDDCLFVNGLGPTESTVTLQYFLNKQTTITQNTVAVGYPVEETEILLLDDTGNHSQIYGEIGIKSAYVALGYWQKPELTSQVFLPDSDDKNQRIYRTGDLGRLRPDGTIEFLGRKDFQVKIRGFRIELGEIETTLNQHPNVKESVVIAREDTLTEKQLVAYYIPQENQTETPQELRNFLQQKLPEYMIPSVFVQLEKLPLTPNGKIDRRALPKPDTSEDKTKDEYIAPRNELELQLQKIWEKVLNVKSISIRDNFFELGGHSLLALQLFSQIKQKIGQDIPLAILFQAPTIEEFASIFHQSESSLSRLVKNPTNLPFQPEESVSYSSLVSIQPNGLKPPLFFTNSIAAAKTLATFLSSEQPLYGLSIFGLPDMDEKQLSSLRIEDIAEQFIQDMRYIQPEGPYLIGAYCGDARIAFEMAQQLDSQGEKVAQLAFIDVVWNPHNLGSNLYWQNFQKIGFDYLRKKIRGKLNLTRENIIRLINKINESFHSKIDENVDLKIKHEKLLQAFYKARKIYVPQTYSGQIALFLSREWQLKNSSELANLATGGLEIQEIPGYHNLLFEEPYVQVLAEKLQSCLDRAVVEYQIK